jgi:tRNA dimethylallyltransferase
MKKLPQLVAVVGPTATGKSDLAVELALKFGGEVISADSRQVYRGLDIGTGKITPAEMKEVPHWLLDVVNPDQQFTVIDYKDRAERVINQILDRERLPILVGGTGLYIQAVVDDLALPNVPPNKKLRSELEGRPMAELYELLKRVDPERAKNIDQYNPRRLIRALEIFAELGYIPKPPKPNQKYDVLFIGLDLPDDRLRQRINERLASRLENGMIEEVKELHRRGLSYDRLESLGLEYRYLALFLQNNLNRQELKETLQNKIWQYARRQRTWFKHNEKIHWFNPTDQTAITELVGEFIKK